MQSFLTFLLTIIFTVSASAQGPNSKYTIIPYSNKVSVTLLKNGKATKLKLFGNQKSTVLTKPDISELDILLKQAIQDYALYRDSVFIVQENEYHAKHPDVPGGIIHYPRKKPDHLFDLTNARRQYVAVLNDEGEKEVLVNCFCYSVLNQENWTKRLIPYEGDQSCHFNLIINLTTKTYYHINEICVNCK